MGKVVCGWRSQQDAALKQVSYGSRSRRDPLAAVFPATSWRLEEAK
jgi:hypothetical protein